MKPIVNKEGKPQAVQKMVNYLNEFINSDYFQGQIKKIRKDLGIPKDGYPIKPKDERAIKTLDIFYLHAGITREKSRNCKIALKEILDKFPVSEINISYGFFVYLLHNTIRPELFAEGFFLNNLCRIVDMKEVIDDREGVSKALEETMQNMTARHPIALYIRPEATQRDIVEYVKKMWGYIEIYKNKYTNKESRVGKIRRKNKKIKERNELIYQNRHLPKKKIMKLVGDKFGEDAVIDYGYIGKIISIEKKKRKEV